MKKVFKNSELFHVWNSQHQKEGKNTSGNITFAGKYLYSYSQCIANLIDLNNVLLINNNYSNTTAKHNIDAFHATKNKNRIFVKYPVVHKGLKGNINYCYHTPAYKNKDVHKLNIDDLLQQLKNSFNSFYAAKKYYQSYFETNKQVLKNITEYCTILKCKSLLTPGVKNRIKKYTIPEDINTIHFIALKENRLKDIEKENEAYNKKIWQKYNQLKEEYFKNNIPDQELEQQAVNNWLTGESNNTYFESSFPYYLNRYYSKWKIDTQYFRRVNFDKCYLRIKGEEVETSKGAKVPIREAKILWQRIKDNKPLKGVKIGYYTVISFQDDILKIGCHNIGIDEIIRFVKLNNW